MVNFGGLHPLGILEAHIPRDSMEKGDFKNRLIFKLILKSAISGPDPAGFGPDPAGSGSNPADPAGFGLDPAGSGPNPA